ncbi:hypothetical protein [Calidifontibacter indicus]
MSVIPEPWLLQRGFTTIALLAATTLLSALRKHSHDPIRAKL